MLNPTLELVLRPLILSLYLFRMTFFKITACIDNLLRSFIQKIIFGYFRKVEAVSRYGSRFIFKFPEDVGYERIYCTGEYETGTTKILRSIIMPSDAVFDIGANMGWYTNILAKKLGSGHCHSFEPLPSTFDKLRANCLLNKIDNKVTLNNTALGDGFRKSKIYVFPNLPQTGVLNDLGHKDFLAYDIQMNTLDRYITEHRIDKIDFIKCDADGSEMLILKGANKVFALSQPPMWLFEVAFEHAKAFGYAPRDIFEFLQSKANYTFYKIKGGWGEFSKLKSLNDLNQADNILCIIPELHRSRHFNSVL